MLIYYQTSIMDSISIDFFVQHLEMPYFAISLSLNILITLMITTRLIRHSRNIRNAIGPARDNGLYNTVVTMLIESCVLYAIVSLLCIVSLATGGGFQGIVDPIFPIIQVRIVFYHSRITLLRDSCLIPVTSRSSLHP